MKTEPYAHQAVEYEASRDAQARALLWQMRTGKSKVVIDTAFHLRNEGRLDGVLVLAPNGVHANWIRRELPKHAWDSGYTPMTWRSSLEGMDDAALFAVKRGDFPVLTVNNEALRLKRTQTVIRALLRRGRIMFVADECHDFRRPGAKRTWLARTLAAKCAYRRILSGTTVLNSPLHAFSQFELLGKGALGYDTFKDFKRHFATCAMIKTRSGRAFPTWTPRRLDELRDRMARWSSVVLRGDVDDMPDLIENEHMTLMSQAQATAYRQVVDEWTLDLEGRTSIDVVEGGVRIQKLQQILGGFVYDEDGEAVSIDDSPPRLDAMYEHVVDTLPGKTIIWCRFREDIRRVVGRLRSMGFDPLEYHGGISSSRKDAAEDRFREELAPNPLVGNPQSAGLGLDLSTADTIFVYSHTHNSIVTEQSKERATAIGGKSVSLVKARTPGTVDDLILTAHEENLSVHEFLAGPGLKHRLLELLDATDV